MRQLTILAAGALAAALASSSALAWTGVATGDVNLRSADSVQGAKLATIPAGAYVEVHGCPTWCNLTFEGITGWASPNYIAPADGRPAPRVYHEERPRVYSYYRDRDPYWYDGPFYWRDHRPYRRWRDREPGFGFYFGF
ncbi:MAG: SH3 domain-containing protein [Propylenella sp.]